MLCSMCQHGVNKKDCWDCECGETNCRHIDQCQCGKRKPKTRDWTDFEKHGSLTGAAALFQGKTVGVILPSGKTCWPLRHHDGRIVWDIVPPEYCRILARRLFDRLKEEGRKAQNDNTN